MFILFYIFFGLDFTPILIFRFEKNGEKVGIYDLTFIIPNKILRILSVLLDIL